jgi:hypothetical protein
MRQSLKHVNEANLQCAMPDDVRIPAFTAFPIIKVVQPAYHSRDGKRGQGSF